MRLKEYEVDQIEIACGEGEIVYVSFHDDKIMVQDAEVEKVTAKCVFFKTTSNRRIDKTAFGEMIWGGVYCIKGDELAIMDDYYSRKQSELRKEMEAMQARIDKMQKAKEEHIIWRMNPKTKKYEKDELFKIGQGMVIEFHSEGVNRFGWVLTGDPGELNMFHEIQVIDSMGDPVLENWAVVEGSIHLSQVIRVVAHSLDAFKNLLVTK